jgi:Flp pilus assembly pilin Flp
MYRYRAQSMVEYALLLGVVSAALIAMQFYMKRGIQGAVKVSADQLGPQQGTQVLIDFKKQSSASSVTNTAASGSIRTQRLEDGSQRKDINTTTESSSVATSQVITETE